MPNYITPPGLNCLKKELEELLRVERPKVVATVAWAASNGDRSENADYIYGKRRLREIDRRIGFLTRRIEEAQVVDPMAQNPQQIFFGARVTIDDEDSGQKTIQIVGEDEIDTARGKISWKSPLAKALIGKKVGDEVQVQKPKGPVWVEIIAFDYQSL
jgi:transcription elongation factor GreB